MTEPEAQPQGGELLPCPFCGGSLITPEEVFNYPNDENYLCSSCGASAPKYQWNTRADLPRATADDGQAWSSHPAEHGYYWMRQGDYLDFVEVDDGPYMRGFKLSGKTQEFVDAGWEFLGPVTPRATGETTVNTRHQEQERDYNET
jgi:hypothetical protein